MPMAKCFARATGVAKVLLTRATCFARVLQTRVAGNEGLRRVINYEVGIMIPIANGRNKT